MLCLVLTPGEYLTIGDDVVLQLDRMSGDRCRLVIHAPQEVPVLRGEVLERNGGKRPDCVLDAPRWHKPSIPWDRSKAQALTAMRTLLGKMDGRDSNVQTLRRQLEHIFPEADTALRGPEGRPAQEPGGSCAEQRSKEAAPARGGDNA